MNEALAVLIVFWVICGIVTGAVASSKGRDGVGWFFIGCILGFFGIVLIALLPTLIPATVQVVGSASVPHRVSDTRATSQISLDQPSVAGRKLSYDLRKWQVLKEIDDGIASAATRVRALDARLEDELAEKYLVLNDRSYLAAIERQLTDKFSNEREDARSRVAGLDVVRADSSLIQMREYAAMIAATDQIDLGEDSKVVGVEPYSGRWVPAQGGIKVTLENGRVLLINKAFRRSFNSDAATL